MSKNAATAPRWNTAITAKKTQLSAPDFFCINSAGGEAPAGCDSARRIDMESPPRSSREWLVSSRTISIARCQDRVFRSSSSSRSRTERMSRIAHSGLPSDPRQLIAGAAEGDRSMNPMERRILRFPERAESTKAIRGPEDEEWRVPGSQALVGHYRCQLSAVRPACWDSAPPAAPALP